MVQLSWLQCRASCKTRAATLHRTLHGAAGGVEGSGKEVAAMTARWCGACGCGASAASGVTLSQQPLQPLSLTTPAARGQRGRAALHCAGGGSSQLRLAEYKRKSVVNAEGGQQLALVQSALCKRFS